MFVKRPLSALIGALALASGFIASSASAAAGAEDRRPDVEFSGVLNEADSGARKTFTFTVPKGVSQVRVATVYDRAKGTTLTLGVYDPFRFRGWGGGVKPSFTIAETFATPSFNPGPIPPGVWRLAMTVAHVGRQGAARYHIGVYFARPGDIDASTFSPIPLKNEAGWYRGDLHSHTGHSDAVCRSLAGKSAPCPVFFTLKAAVDADLDFIAVTDHNATSQFESMAEMQPYFDTLLLLPGREVTTAFGHFNLIGTMGAVETDPGAPDGGGSVNAVLEAATATGGFVSLNHPATPTGEDCLGCGWINPNTNYSAVQGIEAVNGGSIADARGRPEAHEAAVRMHIGFWQDLLNKGYRLTGVAGSDNHDAIQVRGNSPIGPQSPVGYPATVVYADALSQSAILAGLRSGRVFMDLGSGRGRVLDLSARIGEAAATMGGALALPAGGADLAGRIHVVGAPGSRVELLVDGAPRALAESKVIQQDQVIAFNLKVTGDAKWLRVNVEDSEGRLLLLSNPIYFRAAVLSPTAANPGK
jgi:hypothetical protein